MRRCHPSCYDTVSIIFSLSRFSKVFKTASKVLCGEKYPTVSLVLLSRAEIEHALEIIPTDCSLVRELKENMQRSLDHRMPGTDLQVTAAMLDPSQLNLSAVQKFTCILRSS